MNIFIIALHYLHIYFWPTVQRWSFPYVIFPPERSDSNPGPWYTVLWSHYILKIMFVIQSRAGERSQKIRKLHVHLFNLQTKGTKFKISERKVIYKFKKVQVLKLEIKCQLLIIKCACFEKNNFTNSNCKLFVWIQCLVQQEEKNVLKWKTNN